MSQVAAVFKITPMAAPRQVHSDRWSKRTVVLRYYGYKDQLRIIAGLHGYTVDPVLSLTFILPMPKSWSEKKKQAMVGEPHQQKPDLDNLIKAFKDALCADDAFVHTYKDMSKTWGKEGAIIVRTELKPVAANPKFLDPALVPSGSTEPQQ